ncbi:MAG: hypothetical protein Ta2A_12750 [Treponemataceae bacterium]|nr:MAG: hypothetical protein Ta2A_12750 [Treponemataceae bacterium]
MKRFRMWSSILEELKQMVQPSDGDESVNMCGGEPAHKNMKKDVQPGEVFRKYPNPEWTSRGHSYEVSNFGRIKLGDEILEQSYDKPGYLKVHGKCVYRYVAETWCNPPENTKGWEVHHITNNGYDNRPSNLIWIQSGMHRQIPTIPGKASVPYTDSPNEDSGE